MTATTVSSALVTDILASPPTVSDNPGARKGDVVRSVAGTLALETTSIDEADDTVLLFPLKASDRLISLVLFNDDLDGACPALAVDVGLFKNPNADGTSSTIVDQDAYASAITALQAAVTAGTEVAFEARNITKMGQTVAEDGGETLADVGDALRYVGIIVTTAAGTAQAGDISFRALISSR